LADKSLVSATSSRTFTGGFGISAATFPNRKFWPTNIIKAFDETIKPSLKDYLPKREELISGAYNLFLASIQVLAKSYGG
jgi:hypothetical protein